jgi:pantothenate kinase
MTDTGIKIPLESQTWYNYLSDLISCPKKAFDIEGIPIQLNSPEESVTSKSPLPHKDKIKTPKPDPNIPKLT